MTLKKILRPQFVLIGVYLLVAFFSLQKIPNTQTLLEIIKDLYETHGYFLIFFSAFFEAMLLFSFFIPGSAVILLGAALSKTGIIQFPFVIVLATLGLLFGYIVNYLLGKYGWYKLFKVLGFEKGIETSKLKLERHKGKIFLIGCISPGTASFLSTAAGILNFPFKKFLILSFIGQSFWSILWGTLTYFLGIYLIEIFMKYSGLVLIIVIVGLFLKSRIKLKPQV